MRGAALLLLGLVLAQQPAISAAQRNAGRWDASLHAFLQAEFREMRDEIRRAHRRDPGLRYSRAYADLNGDGRREAIVYLTGSQVCGSGGCNLFIYTFRAGTWHRIADLSVTWTPIRLLETRSQGWRDLGVFVAGGGVLPGYHALIPFDGRTYASNPSRPPARELRRPVRGRLLISENDRRRPLF